MPRPPKLAHPLREMRRLLGGMSQTVFAELVGVSMPTIQALEGGKLKLTAKLAARISEVTGASDAELLKGSNGKARTLDGQKFSLTTFQTWSTQRQRRTKQAANADSLLQWTKLLLEAAEERGESTFQSIRTQVVEDLERLRQKSQLGDQINDRLAHHQTVETHSAEIQQWKKADHPRIQGLGFHPSIPLTGKRRLTISLQKSATWSPGTAPPSIAPTNMDLIPAGYFVIGLGTAGCRMAEAWWEALCREHGINFQTGYALDNLPTGSWQGFFRRVPQSSGPDKFVPRALFADLDPESLGAIAQRGSDLFHSAAFFQTEQGSGNVFCGANHAAAAALVTSMEQLLRRHSQDVGGVSGIFLLHSLEGGSGGGLAHQWLGKLQQNWSTCPIISVCPLPDPALGHSVTAPYNLALTLEAVDRASTLSLFFDPPTLEEESIRLWKKPVQEVEKAPNQLIAANLCAFTAPLRFPGADSPPYLLPDWLEQLIEPITPATSAYVMPEIRPWQSRFTGKKTTATTEELVKQSAPFLKAMPKWCATNAALFLRARPAEDIWGTARATSANATEVFRFTESRNPDRREYVSFWAGPGILESRLRTFAAQAEQLVHRKAYLHWYSPLGLDETTIAAAVAHLKQIADRLAGNSLT
jgi:transcriptional regulator with XRE-family HTH domain